MEKKWILVLAVVFLAVLIVLLRSRAAKKKKGGRHGCKSGGSCQNMHLGKAKDAGYDSDVYTYCKAAGGFVERRASCPNFRAYGCRSGICAYSTQHSRGQCYCRLYKKTVATRESCPGYLDFFNTQEGQGLLDSLQVKR